MAQRVTGELQVEFLHCIRNFTEWLKPHRVTIYHCWGNREGIEAPHSFTFKQRGDLSLEEQQAAAGDRSFAEVLAGYGRRTHFSDVYCIVKAYMRDTERNQAPVLVLPKDRRDCVQGPAPTTVETLHFELGRKNQLEHLANLLEKPDYGYYKASASIRAMIQEQYAQCPGAGWLTRPPCNAHDEQPIDNPFFPHLPEKSWSMKVSFRRAG